MGTPRAVARGDEGYPERFESLARPPRYVYLEGPWSHDGPIVAIVGSRRANGDGLDVARSLAADLAGAGAAVISGLALGIDAAAHEGALDAGGVSGAILGTPLDRAHPRRHASLQRRLAASLGILSELAPGTNATKGTFVSRNRLVAALADVVVVVQGRNGSGSLITADFARELGRPVGAIPWDPRERLGAAPLSLLVSRHASLVRGAWDVFDLIAGAGGPTGKGAAGVCGAASPLANSLRSLSRRSSLTGHASGTSSSSLDLFMTEREARLLRALRHFAEPLDIAAERARLTSAEASSAFVVLELAGRATRVDGGLVRRTRKKA